MNDAINITCVEYVREKIAAYKGTPYYARAKGIKSKHPGIYDGIMSEKANGYKAEWREAVLEYGSKNKLPNRIIYSYIREYGHDQLLYDFRRRPALEGWVPSERFTI